MALPAPSPQKKPQRSQSSGVVDLSRARPRPVEPSGPTAQPDNAIYPDTPQWKKQGQVRSPQQSAQEQSQREGGATQDLPAYQEEELKEDVYQEGDGGFDAEASQQDRPHFSFIEAFFLIAINIIADLVELLDLTGVGAIIGFVVDWIIGPTAIFWLWMKGIDMIGRNTVAQALEFIPYVDILPIRSIAIILTIIATNKPELFEKAGVIGDVAEVAITKGKSLNKQLAQKTIPKKEE